MQRLFILFILAITGCLSAQITCGSLQTTGGTHSLVACKSGKAKLFYTDTAITNKFKYKSFNVKLVSELSETERADIKKFKFALKQTDTVIVYDWDIMHQAKIGYFGPAIGRLKFNCKDSTLTIYKYLLKKETTDYVPTHFKIFRMGADNFIIMDSDHPYLNINYYFKQKVVFSSGK